MAGWFIGVNFEGKILTGRWQWTSCGTWLLAKGRSLSRSGKGKTRGADCGGNWPEVPDQNPG